MNAYIPDLADEVLVTRGPHAGGVGTVTDIDDDRGFFVEGAYTTTGEGFARWQAEGEVVRACWGDWHPEILVSTGHKVVGRTVTADPIYPLSMFTDLISDHDAQTLTVQVDEAGREIAIRTAHIVTVEVVVTARRDHR